MGHEFGHLYNTCHVSFTLHVYHQTLISGRGGGLKQGNNDVKPATTVQDCFYICNNSQGDLWTISSNVWMTKPDSWDTKSGYL